MEEIIDNTRRTRKILISPKHFSEKVMNDNLFSSIEKAFKITTRAIKSFGVLVEPIFEKEDCKYHCIFYSDLKKIVCCPVRLVGKNTFFVPTVYPANKWQEDAFKEIISKRKQSKK